MRHTLALVFGSVILAGSALSASYAQDQQKPAEQASPGQTTPSGHEMGGQMQHMMGNPEMMGQMQHMMENCNKMMESMMQHSPATTAPAKGG